MRRVVRSCCGAMLVLAGTMAHAADDPWGQAFMAAAPAAVFDAAEAVSAPGEDVVVLYEESQHTFDDVGRCELRYRLVYRILTEAGLESWDRIAVSYAPWHQKRPTLRARVLRPDGSSFTLDPDTVAEVPVGDPSEKILTDRRRVRAHLPGLAVGAVVEQELVVRDNAPFFAAGAVFRFQFGFRVPVSRTKLIIERPEALPLHVSQELLEIVPTVSRSGGRVRLEFESGRLEPLEPAEPSLPRDVPRWPTIRFSTGRSWQGVAARYHAIVEAQLEGADLGPLVESLLDGTRDRKEVAARLIAWLHETVRYAGVELGESSLVPRRPAEVLERRYGDCKDQAALLVALLRAAGWRAQMALLRSDVSPEVDPALPGFGSFNHAIVYVPAPEPLWIDPAARFARVGELPSGDQGRLVLIIDPATSELVRAPEAGADENRTVETREFWLAPEGEARILETSQMSGEPERLSRGYYDALGSDDTQEELQQYAQNEYLAKEGTTAEISDPSDLSVPLRFRIEVARGTRGLTRGHEAVVAIRPETITRELGISEDDPPTRTQPYDAGDPFVYEWDYRVVPPNGFTADVPPEPDVTSFGPARLSRRFSVEPDGVVAAAFELRMDVRVLTAAEYGELRQAVAAWEATEPLLLRFVHRPREHLLAGRLAEAIAGFRELAAAEPAEARHRSDLAEGLLAAGIGVAAREHAEAAVRLAPQSARTSATLGRVLEHDLIGRLREPGFDREGAVAAYRRAKELDPADTAVRSSLAILLEYDASGRRYAPGCDLEQAIVEYDALRSELDHHGMDENLLVALFWNEQYERLLQLAREMPRGPRRDAFLLTGLAAARGAEAALAEAEGFADQPAPRQEALATAGDLLCQARLYPQAVALLEAASEGASDAAELRARIEVLRRTRRYETLPLDGPDPLSLVKRFYVTALLGGSGSELVGMFDPRIVTSEADFMAAWESGVRGALRRLQSSIPLPVLVDGALAAFSFSVEGSRADGYEVRARGASAAGAADQRLFLVWRDDGYRLLATSEDLSGIGVEALERAAAGDLRGARVWLDRARRLMQPVGGDDPLAGASFPLLWNRGQDGDREAIRAAAACLMAGHDAARALEILRGVRQGTTDPDRRTRLDVAMAKAYLAIEDHASALKVAERLCGDYPQSLSAFNLRSLALTRLDRWEEAQRAAEERLARMPGDVWALRELASLAEARGLYDEAADLYGSIIDSGQAASLDYNNGAWLALFREAVTETDLERARRAVHLAGAGGGERHTLATLYAEMGRPAEARETLLESIAAAGGAIAAHDWYVVGRLAEHYGAAAAAVDAYHRVQPAKSPMMRAVSTYRLAQGRLAALERDVESRLRPTGR